MKVIDLLSVIYYLHYSRNWLSSYLLNTFLSIICYRKCLFQFQITTIDCSSLKINSEQRHTGCRPGRIKIFKVIPWISLSWTVTLRLLSMFIVIPYILCRHAFTFQAVLSCEMYQQSSVDCSDESGNKSVVFLVSCLQSHGTWSAVPVSLKALGVVVSETPIFQQHPPKPQALWQ